MAAAGSLLRLLIFLADTGTSPPPAADHAIVVALITVLGGGCLGVISSFVITRGGHKPHEDALPIVIAGDDHADDVLELAQRVGAYRTFLARAGYDPDRITTGMESPDTVRSA